MKNKVILILTILFFSTLWFGCSSEKKEENNIIKIGAILPLTGNLAFLGQPEKNALELFNEEIKQNGTSQFNFKLFFEDSKGEPKAGIAAVNKLISVNNIKIFFTTATLICFPTQPIIEKAGGIQFAISMHPKLAEKSDATFRIFPSGRQEAEKLIELHKKIHSKNIAILYGAVPEMRSEVEDYLIPGLTNSGIKVSLSEQYNLTQREFKNIISKVINYKIDGIIIIGFGFNIPPILKELRAFKFNKAITGGIGFLEMANSEQKDLFENIKFIAPAIITSKSSKATKFRDAYYAKYKKEPPYDAYFIYDSFQILLKGISEAKSLNNINEIKQKIISIKNFNGVTGKINILPNGDSNVELGIMEFKNGKIVPIDSEVLNGQR